MRFDSRSLKAKGSNYCAVRISQTPRITRAALHVRLGEWELAKSEDPPVAQWHFHQAQRLSSGQSQIYGLAGYDHAIAMFYRGAYGEAASEFKNLVSGSPRLSGFDRRDCALFSRHANACAGYHAERAKLGIPEPARLDPMCGAAALATYLRANRLPFDRQSVLKNCRVTGRGSSLDDVLTAARRFGLSARTVTADDAGLIALPKPVIAYVEHDHFVALVGADKNGVSYVCSDCGSWPGGKIDLTWKQWHKMDPGLYAVMCPRQSDMDHVLPKLTSRDAGGSTGLQIASTQIGGNIARQATLLYRLLNHVVLFGGTTQYCGFGPAAQHCGAYTCCPKDDHAGKRFSNTHRWER